MIFLRRTWITGVLALLICSCGPEISENPKILAQLPDKVDFNYHIKPILSDRCYTCHGPDDNKREAGLRLDTEEGAFAELSENPGHYALVGGKLGKSEVYHRMVSTDPDIQMPLPESNLSLSEYEIALINKWIDQGAEWKPHWAFIPPNQPTVPEVRNTADVRNTLDHFVLQRLEKEGLTLSPEADKERLLRRAYLDLTGLPPTIKEMDEFLADDAPNAFEKVIDHLLTTDEYAERMAMEWMDVARYADSHGMHADGWRSMWPWRDWVIKAFKGNLSYDEFITWQLAGDLIPDAKQEQILATAFHRNHPMTAEGGAVEEEFRLEYVFDRANTTATAFMGLTLECARCHDHKFDPISQEDFYKVSAFFNNVKELGMTGDDGNYGPMLQLPEKEAATQLQELEGKIQQAKKSLLLTQKEIADTKSYLETFSTKSPQPKGLVADFPLNNIQSRGKEKRADGKANGKIRGNPELVEGKFGKALEFEGEYDGLDLLKTGIYELSEPFSASAWINTDRKGIFQTIMGNAGNKNNFWRGWDFYLDTTNRVSVRLIHALPHNYVHVRTKKTISPKEWQHVAFTYDGTAKATGIQIFIDGELVETSVEFDRLYKTIKPVTSGNHALEERPLRIGKSYRAFTGENGIFDGNIDEIKIFNQALSAWEMAAVAGLDLMKDKSNEHLSAEDEAILLDHFVRRNSQEYAQGIKELRSLRNEQRKIYETIDEIMVMEEMPKPRATFVLNRGQYDSPTKEVKPGTPEAVLPFPEDLPANRLGLAKWLTSKEHPLTARVTVNRYWQMLFGEGLVRTPQDFGNQGSLPTHPELLDWLAVDFMESGWDVRHLLKTIVLSATYRQQSNAGEELQTLDPDNMLLARGPSHRLPAEMIRDNALAASGLLVKHIGGESVRPYQPEGLWIDKGTFSHVLLRYIPDTGDSLYRRSMYTFVKRTSPHPAMVAFDAPDRSTCIVKREKTNTPLQALVLLNDPQFVEPARILAERMQKEGGETLNAKITLGFRLLTGRKPLTKEVAIFEKMYEQEKAKFQRNPDEAKDLLNVGEFPRDKNLDPAETAAFTMIASTIMNHDEAYMKR